MKKLKIFIILVLSTLASVSCSYFKIPKKTGKKQEIYVLIQPKESL